MKKNLLLPIYVITVILLLLSACQTHKKRPELPSDISIQLFDTDQAYLELLLTYRKNNIAAINNISCQLAIKDGPNIQLQTQNIPDLTPYANELIRFNIDPADSQADLGKSFKYVLDCYLNFQDDIEHIIKRSVMYQIPQQEKKYR